MDEAKVDELGKAARAAAKNAREVLKRVEPMEARLADLEARDPEAKARLTNLELRVTHLERTPSQVVLDFVKSSPTIQRAVAVALVIFSLTAAAVAAPQLLPYLPFVGGLAHGP